MEGLASKLFCFLFHSVSIIFSVLIIYYSSPGSTLFSWHPVISSMAVSILMSQGLVIFDPSFSPFTSTDNKQSTVNRHLIIQLLAAVLLLVGFLVVYINKNLHSKPHFVSWHGCLGLTALLVLPLSLLGGTATNLGLRLANIRPWHIRWVHQVASTVLYTLCLIVMALGLLSGWAEKNMGVVLRCVLATFLAVMLVGAWDQARKRFLFKIFQVPATSRKEKR